MSFRFGSISRLRHPSHIRPVHHSALRSRPDPVFHHPSSPPQPNSNMPKNKKYTVPNESHLSLPAHPNAATRTTPIIDTHTHLLTTFSSYKTKYPTGRYDTVWDFVRGVYDGRNVKAIVDVWCEAPVQRAWKEVADSALSAQDRAEKWGGIEYWFVMGKSGPFFSSDVG